MLKRLLMILAIAAMFLPLGATVGCDDDVEIHEQRQLEVHELPVSTETVVE
ncbi:MAG: hypothetical protein KAU28_03055 [Phycisphaerae bacterium]|nr:hypothetical protein [Phycisphaerae bacterium]